MIKLEDKEMSFNFINRGDLYMTFKSSVKWLSLFSGSLLLAACGNEEKNLPLLLLRILVDIHDYTKMVLNFEALLLKLLESFMKMKMTTQPQRRPFKIVQVV